MKIGGLTYDAQGKHFYQTGIDGVVLFVYDGTNTDVTGKVPGYKAGVAWSGVTAVNESPSGADSNKLYADNIEYLNLLSKEEFGFTIEGHDVPEDFDACDGIYTDSGAKAVKLTGQDRAAFCLVYRVLKGTDTVAAGGDIARSDGATGTGKGYIWHIVYGAKAAPSGGEHGTVNDSPEAVTFSYECTTTPITEGLPIGVASCAHLEIDASLLNPKAFTAVQTLLYGSDQTGPTGVPTPEAIITAAKTPAQ